MARPGVLCLLVALGVGRAGAADLPGSTAAAPLPWTLAVALFSKVEPAALAKTAAPDFSLGDAAAMSASASRDALAATMPNLLRPALSPLPDRRDAKGPGRPATLFDASAAANGRPAAPFVDLAQMADSGGTAETGKKTWDGLVAGFYALAGDSIDCRVLLFEAGAATASRALSWRGDIGSLDLFAEALLPPIVSWIAGKDLGVVDFLPVPGAGAPLSITMETAGQAGTVKGSRLFIAAPGDYDLRIERNGYALRSLRIGDARPGSYRRETVALEPAAAPPAEVSLAGASSILAWGGRDEFSRIEKRYRSALGRFVASVPLTAIALGVFFSYSEARARGAASDASYYASGAGAAAAVGLSLGFVIDCAAGLADLLRVSK